MHPSVMRFVADAVATRGLARLPVLEVGALDVNGTVRGLFTGPYLASDMRPGPGVDRVVNAHNLEPVENDGPFDVLVCVEMLEHDDAPWVTLTELRRVAAPGATLLLTCRGFDERGCFPVHGYPEDHYRYSVTGLERLMERTGWEPAAVTPDPECPGVFAVATCR